MDEENQKNLDSLTSYAGLLDARLLALQEVILGHLKLSSDEKNRLRAKINGLTDVLFQERLQQGEDVTPATVTRIWHDWKGTSKDESSG